MKKWLILILCLSVGLTSVGLLGFSSAVYAQPEDEEPEEEPQARPNPMDKTTRGRRRGRSNPAMMGRDSRSQRGNVMVEDSGGPGGYWNQQNVQVEPGDGPGGQVATEIVSSPQSTQGTQMMNKGYMNTGKMSTKKMHQMGK